MQIMTEEGIVMMACSGEESRVHIHVFAILEKDGNQALAKMALNKLVPEIVEEIAWAYKVMFANSGEQNSTLSRE